jgi:copper(I)-binding protein
MRFVPCSKIFILTAALILTNAPIGLARDFQSGDLTIRQPWSRATPKGAQVATGYLLVKNTGRDPDRFVGGSCDFAGRLEIHEMSVKNGVMTMRPVPKGLEIKPGASIELKPGSFHIMFTQLKHPLKRGDVVKATLTFEKAGDVPVDFVVEDFGAKSGGEDDMPMD